MKTVAVIATDDAKSHHVETRGSPTGSTNNAAPNIRSIDRSDEPDARGIFRSTRTLQFLRQYFRNRVEE